MPDVLRMPPDPLVLGEHPLGDVGRLHVPARLRVVEERRAAAPAVGVGVLVDGRTKQAPVLLEHRDDVLVRRFDEAPGIVGDPLVERAVRLHRVLQGEPVLLPKPEVVLAEGDRGVDEARAVLGRDEVALQDGVPEGAVVRDVAKRRLVARSREGGPRQVGENLRVFAQDPLEQCGGHDEDLLTYSCADVFDLRPDGDCGVGDQRPRRGGPDEEVVAGPQRAFRDRVRRRRLDDGHPHVDGGVFDVLVALRDLVRGERRAAARAVGDHLVAAVEAVGVPDLAKRPPDGLDVLVGHRHVRVVEVDPECDPARSGPASPPRSERPTRGSAG